MIRGQIISEDEHLLENHINYAISSIKKSRGFLTTVYNNYTGTKASKTEALHLCQRRQY